MKKIEGFLCNAEYVIDRLGDYKLRDSIRKDFKFCKSDLGGCGNIHHQMFYDPALKAIQFEADWQKTEKLIPFYKFMSPSLLLYRLIATFEKAPICADNYKSIWEYPLKHKSGKIISFSEHKGAIGFWLPETTYTELPNQFKADLIRLVAYLASNKCAHPYDNLVAGSVA